MAHRVQTVLEADGIKSFMTLNIGYPAEDAVKDLTPTTQELYDFIHDPVAGLILYYQDNVKRFLGSISAGIASAVSEITYVHRECPHAVLILAGYSQGAMVMHQAELQLTAAHDTGVPGQIAGTLLLADGDRVSRTAAREFGTSTDRSQGVRTYLRQSSGKDVPAPSATANICDAGDIVCDFGLNTAIAWLKGEEIHTSYGKEPGLLNAAATWIAELAAARLTPPVTFPGGELSGVTAISATDAWAVGDTSAGAIVSTLTVHWNGTAWKRVPSPAAQPDGELLSVSAASANDVWAGGIAGGHALMLHWNGVAWNQVPIPQADPTYSYISGVAATSATNAWAAEWDEDGTNNTVILHWDGSTWKRASSPGPPGYDNVTSVAAVSAKDAWAAGYNNAGDGSTLIQHWNGSTWKVVPSPTPAGGGYLYGLTAISADDAWAVGSTDVNLRPLILHWNGTVWKQVPAPAPAVGVILWGVGGTSASNAWAVGQITAGNPAALILHWDGTAWKRVSFPALPPSDILRGVAASSASSAWAAGGSILHWDGAAWN
jgi:hypothetical protein